MTSELGSQDRGAVSTKRISVLAKMFSRQAKMLTKCNDEMFNGMFSDRVILMVELPEKRSMKAQVKGNGPVRWCMLGDNSRYSDHELG